MIGRLLQLLSRWVSKLLMLVAGYLAASPEQADGLNKLGEALVAAVGAILLALVDLLIHKVKSGGMMVPAGEVREKKPTTLGDLPTFDRMSMLLMVVGVGVFASVLAGCGVPPNPLKAPAQRAINVYDPVVRPAIAADVTLTAEQKAGRLAALDDFQSAVDAAPPEGRWVPYRWVPGGGVSLPLEAPRVLAE